MKRKHVLAVAMVGASAVLAQSWVAPIQVDPVPVKVAVVTNVVESVVQPAAIRLRHIAINCTTPLTVGVTWEWVDARTNVVRRGTTRLTEAQVDALLQRGGSSVSQMRGLFMGLAAESASE